MLMKRSRLLTAGPHRDAAALLASMARMHAAIDIGERERAATQLVEAATHVDPAAEYGWHWWVLVARAYAETGLSHESQRVREECLRVTPSFALRGELLIQSTRSSIDSLPPEKVAAEMERLQTEGLHAQHQQARLLLAREASRAGRQAEALASCQELIREPSLETETRRDALRLMGRVYQRQGEYELAVACFAGALPADRPAQSPAAAEEQP
ncbi:MAG: hypothetical protein R3B90_04620 [Planctomycetaceae bacterium]